ncbi:DUF488 domain-containing protein [Mucilaginibacter aquariorum]|uniref:DUF488 family protein n=1 Tax=Mucilaginibacter aquariorum TaxID=2967225 RepID=A0ABT1T171_9SPHI|nr:DUF488 family protein [Mucilaginibacter aquariorum]MCQ6958346.1 DUF488 family protein [Mucilaginibacter aquariorum]
MTVFKIKRIYEPAEKADGRRVLVDRLWPRGVKKNSIPVDAWQKDLAPTGNLRSWYKHDPAKWEEFQLRYLLELKHNPAVEDFLRATAGEQSITLLYAAKDKEHNHTLVLQRILEEMSGSVIVPR